MKKKYLLVASFALAVVTGSAMAGGDANAGQVKASTCMGCHAAHSANAVPNYPVPKLGGQHAEYIVSALQAYKSGKRSHPTMQANASGLSDEDMADIAAYFSAMGKGGN